MSFFDFLSELIKELVKATDLKFGMQVEYTLPGQKYWNTIK